MVGTGKRDDRHDDIAEEEINPGGTANAYICDR